jgi:hypothetical protein
MEEVKKFKKIEKKLFEVGFDEFYQAGYPSKFHPLNIVATSKALNKQFWVCVDGGYGCKDTFYIEYRDLNNTNIGTERIKCINQTDVIEKLNNIQFDIVTANGLN